jgi:hypothetical protein
MRRLILACALVIGACASKREAPAAPAMAAAPATANGAPAGARPPLDAAELANAKKLGYTVIDKSGETLYCRTQLRTGSHVNTDTYCLTPKEFEDMREKTQRGLSNILQTAPPPQGH